MIRHFAFATGLAFAIAAAGPAAAQTKTIKLLSSWDRTTIAALEPVLIYQEQIAKISSGKLAIDIKGPETVPPFQQIQPVSAGVFDILHTHGVYHAGSKGLALAVDAIEPDLEVRRTSGVWNYLDQYYQKHNRLKLLSLVIGGTKGYQLVLKEPLSPAGDFPGRKIRANQTYFGVVKALGGTPVVTPPAEMYSALEKGVVSGIAFPASGVLTLKLYEVVHYRVRPTFGTSNTIIAMNQAAWGKLTADEQKLLLDAGREVENIMIKQGDVTLAKEEAELDRLGMKYAQLPPDKVALIKDVWGKSIWELAEQCCADGAKEFREIALKAKLTN
jgi:TRAP-type C4-dicarboxylate transport system substrate-binding protein